MPEKGENALVAWLAERFPPDPARVEVGIGDDMAVVRFGEARVAITADMLLDGVHFDTRTQDLALVGRKAIACSLSDCAAMGCRPVAATVSLALPEMMTLEDVRRLYEGMAGVADAYGCRIVGGDTTSWRGGLAIDVVMLAEPMSPRGPIRRGDARPGDAVFVSGPLGGSLAGRHLSFTPRLALAARLVEEPGLHAMMDLSDGLSMDLHRMCVASGLHAELTAEQLKRAVSPDVLCGADDSAVTPRADSRRVDEAGRGGMSRATEPARNQARDPASAASAKAGGMIDRRLERALNDGEDFELLIAGDEALGSAHPDLIRVGWMVPMSPGAGSFVTLVTADGRRLPVEPRGYEHFK